MQHIVKKIIFSKYRVNVPDLEATAVSLSSSRCLFEGKKERKREENMLAMCCLLHKSACINLTSAEFTLAVQVSGTSANSFSEIKIWSISWHHQRTKLCGRIMSCSMQLHTVQSIFKIEQDPDVILAKHQHCSDKRAGKDS